MKQPCPICQKASVAVMQPFCSKRCADLDLGKWLGGGYAIPAVELDDPEYADGDKSQSDTAG